MSVKNIDYISSAEFSRDMKTDGGKKWIRSNEAVYSASYMNA